MGFAAIKPVLVSEGVYRCPNRTPGSVCFSQELRYVTAASEKDNHMH